MRVLIPVGAVPFKFVGRPLPEEFRLVGRGGVWVGVGVVVWGSGGAELGAVDGG